MHAYTNPNSHMIEMTVHRLAWKSNQPVASCMNTAHVGWEIRSNNMLALTVTKNDAKNIDVCVNESKGRGKGKIERKE